VTVQLARDAMVPEPFALEVSANARDAGEVLSRDAVRAVLVCDEGMLVGVVTRKTLVREVVAAGRDPEQTTLGEIAELPNATIDSELPLDQAFGFLEEQDYERVPVVEDGKLVGVLSRSAIQRRLAEDEGESSASVTTGPGALRGGEEVG
jgi:CBS domain-containing protein